MVEQRLEEPRVAGSNPAGSINQRSGHLLLGGLLCLYTDLVSYSVRLNTTAKPQLVQVVSGTKSGRTFDYLSSQVGGFAPLSSVDAPSIADLPLIAEQIPFNREISLLTQDATKLARASEAEVVANNYAEKAANQLFYTVTAQSGKFFGYAGVGKGGSSGEWNQVSANWKSFTPAFYTVPSNQPRVKVWLVKSASSEEVRSKAEDPTNLAPQWLSVPVPTSGLIPNAGQIWPEGTDKETVFYCASTDEYWEFWGFSKFAAGEHAGEYKAGFGSYIANISQSNGVQPNNWGARASGIAATSGNISHADLVRVLRGGKIGHALGLALVVTKASHLAPATRNDTHENTAGTAETNPAFGNVDAVPEGAWFAFPAASSASEFINIVTEPIAAAIYEAIREYGLFINDTSVTSSAFYISDPRVLGTPYADTTVNPFAGYAGTEPNPTAIAEKINAFVPGSWTDGTLPVIKENFLNNKSVFTKIPWRKLEQLAPRSS